MIKLELKNVVSIIEESIKDPIPNEVLKNFVLRGSKLIRSKLAILYLKSQNFEITDNIYNILAAGEIIHNASLLHDDVLDNADTRRGNKTINKEFDPKISILAGDYLLSIAMELILKTKNYEVLETFKNCTKQMTTAEINQYFLRNKIPTEQEYIDICLGKTASLFSSIIESCAILLYIDKQIAKLFGEKFGICFQIKNDLEETSAKSDNDNGIYTAKDILGIEKTQVLLDNYKKEMGNILIKFPKNIYLDGIEDLLRELCLIKKS